MEHLPDLGQHVSLKIMEGLLEGEYDTRIQAVKDNSLWVDPPKAVTSHRLCRIPRGTLLRMSYLDRADKVPYACETGVVVGNDECLVLERPRKIVRLQRRQFVRVPLSLPVHILAVDPFSRSYATLTGSIHDLSGGGACIILNREQQLYKGDIVGLDFRLPAGRDFYLMTVKARVVHKKTSVDPKAKDRYGVEFLHLHEADRQAIIRHVFKRQVELRKFTGDHKPIFNL